MIYHFTYVDNLTFTKTLLSNNNVSIKIDDYPHLYRSKEVEKLKKKPTRKNLPQNIVGIKTVEDELNALRYPAVDKLWVRPIGGKGLSLELTPVILKQIERAEKKLVKRLETQWDCTLGTGRPHERENFYHSQPFRDKEFQFSADGARWHKAREEYLHGLANVLRDGSTFTVKKYVKQCYDAAVELIEFKHQPECLVIYCDNNWQRALILKAIKYIPDLDRIVKGRLIFLCRQGNKHARQLRSHVIKHIDYLHQIYQTDMEEVQMEFEKILQYEK